jgi:uncharacterized membrane protein YoaK (UPF0700 family)
MDDRDRDLKINSLEINQNTMAENLKELKDDVKLGFEKTDKSFDEIKLLIKEVASGKANKWVESFILWVGAIVGAGFLGYLGNLVYKATINFN